MPLDLDKYDAVLLDLDGTVYHEEHALPGAVELIRQIQAEGRVYACLTNSTSSPERLTARLNRMGVRVDPFHIYTAAAATCDYVLQQFGGTPGPAAQTGTGADLAPEQGKTVPSPVSTSVGERRARVYNLSTEGVHEMLEGRVHWVQRADEPCDAVICGVPLNVYATEERQRVALVLLRQGASLVSICADRIYPSPRGLEFGVGAMSAMMSYAANVTPTFCGKPERIFFTELCHRLRVAPERCVLVGDNLESDIAGGKGVGMSTILTLSGVATRADVESLPQAARPDAIISDLRDLL
jgi:HAD superfamily hydrolase (TIGR01450 family)